MLYAAYMPFLENGGIFLPSTSYLYEETQAKATPGLNDELCLLLQLFDEPEPRCCITRVVWVTPVSQAPGQRAGMGLQFGRNDYQMNSLIASRLAEHKTDSVQSQTL